MRNLFEKKTYNMEREDIENEVWFPSTTRKPLFEYEGRLDDMDDQRKFSDMNL